MPANKVLEPYRRKRDFRPTPEPSGSRVSKRALPRFVVQKHNARRLHYDLRLETDGVLASWAVPRGPSLNPRERRLAMRVEDHPLDYADFEGVIPEGEYGAGEVIVWDRGAYRNLKEGRHSLASDLRAGHVVIWLEGEKLKGGFSLVRTGGEEEKQQWLLIKMRDPEANERSDILEDEPRSVISGRTIEEIAAPNQKPRRRRKSGDVEAE